MLIGESASLRLVDQNGHAQHNVSWTLPDREAFQAAAPGDQLAITAKRAGEFRISAQSANGSAEATVTVMAGTALPEGTTRWSGAAIKGCTTTNVIPATPAPNGPDLFEESQCEDGQYVAAYTADGIQLWRRKVGSSGATATAVAVAAAPATPAVAGGRLNPSTKSFCDLASVGTTQQKIRELLDQRGLSFIEGAPSEHTWTVEESNAQCKLWFDDKAVVARKRKTFLN